MTPEEYFRRQTAMLGAEHGATPPAREPVNPLRYYMGPLADTLNNFGNLAWMLSPGDDYQYSAEGFGKMLDADLPWLDRLAGLGGGVLADQYGPASEGDKNALRGYLEKVGL
jgi:hypothetical protein